MLTLYCSFGTVPLGPTSCDFHQALVEQPLPSVVLLGYRPPPTCAVG